MGFAMEVFALEIVAKSASSKVATRLVLKCQCIAMERARATTQVEEHRNALQLDVCGEPGSVAAIVSHCGARTMKAAGCERLVTHMARTLGLQSREEHEPKVIEPGTIDR